jgi:hypothetical protein
MAERNYSHGVELPYYGVELLRSGSTSERDYFGTEHPRKIVKPCVGSPATAVPIGIILGISGIFQH